MFLLLEDFLSYFTFQPSAMYEVVGVQVIKVRTHSSHPTQSRCINEARLGVQTSIVSKACPFKLCSAAPPTLDRPIVKPSGFA